MHLLRNLLHRVSTGSSARFDRYYGDVARAGGGDDPKTLRYGSERPTPRRSSFFRTAPSRQRASGCSLFFSANPGFGTT